MPPSFYPLLSFSSDNGREGGAGEWAGMPPSFGTPLPAVSRLDEREEEDRALEGTSVCSEGLECDALEERSKCELAGIDGWASLGVCRLAGWNGVGVRGSNLDGKVFGYSVEIRSDVELGGAEE